VSKKKQFNVLVTDKVSGGSLTALLDDDRFEVVLIDDSKDPSFKEALKKANGLIVRSATKVKAEMLDGAPNLAVVGRAGVGVDNIDLVAATARGVAVLNAPAGNTVSTAELTMALILAMVRGVAAADASVRKGEWARSRFQGAELRGRTLGLIGAGRIGGTVAKRCRAFGMDVVAYDPYRTDDGAAAMGVERADLDAVIERADIISLHVPLTDDTRGLISKASIARMKKGSYVVNVSRGGVVDEPALAEALTSGHLAGAALDVYENEPLEADSPLRTAPNLILMPHLGASTQEAQELVASEIAGAVRAALADGDLTPALNAPAVGGELLRRLGPLLELGSGLGNLAAAMAPGGIQSLDVRYAGASDEALKPLTAYVLIGLLRAVLGADQVNFVSAGHLAEQRGIKVARTQLSEHADYTEYVELVIKAERGGLRLAGALLGDAHPRIVRMDDYHVDIVPSGSLVVLKNKDVPGVIGRVGTILGDHDINIAGYHQARLSKGGDALAAVSVDGDVDQAVRDALLELPEVTAAVVVRLA
jgi:D-3-phosphoglycerate dehydrogenase